MAVKKMRSAVCESKKTSASADNQVASAAGQKDLPKTGGFKDMPGLELGAVSKTGVASFSVPLQSMDPAWQTLLKDAGASRLGPSVGEEIIRLNLDRFKMLIQDRKDYEQLCRKYRPKAITVVPQNEAWQFHFHISLLHRLINETLSAEFKEDKGPGTDTLSPAAIEQAVCERTAETASLASTKPKDKEFHVMSKMFETVVRFFDEKEWKYERRDEDETLIAGFTAKNGKFRCIAICKPEQDILLFRTLLSVMVPEEKRLEAAEFLTRANYGLVLGGFEMDMSDGEVGYKTSIDVEGGELTPALVGNMVHPNIQTADRYYPGLMKLLYGNLTPKEAVESIEKRKSSDEDG